MDTVKKKILLVEDEPITAMLEKQQLEDTGYSINHVMNGEDAVQHALNKYIHYDLILMDIDLGTGIDGTQAAQQILRHIDIPIIFLSSHTEPEIVEKTEKITSYGYVVKNSGIVVLDASIKMAFKLFEAKMEHKKAEDRIATSDDRFHRMLAVVPDMISIHDTDMNILYSNWNGFASVPKENQLLHTKCYKTYRNYNEICPDCRAKEVLVSGQPVHEIFQLEGNNWFELRVIPIFEQDKNVEFFVEWVRDITVRKQAEEEMRIKNEELDTTNEELNATLEEMEAANEELIVNNNELLRAEKALSETEERFRVLHNASFGGIAIHDKDIILECNLGLSDMMGYSRDELLSMDSFLLISPDSRELVKNNVKNNFEKPYEAYGMRKNGEIFPMRLEARTIPYKGKNVRVVEFRDITDQKIAENELKDKTSLLSMLMETSPVGITTVDKNGKITYANRRAEEILGLEKEKITSISYDAPLWDHTDLDGSPLADEKQPFNIVKTTMNTAYNIQHGITWPNGKVVLLSINASPMKDVHGNFDGMVATIEDVTEAKKNEMIIIQQLNEKEMMLKEVHHRIKNNISSIESLLSLQADDTTNMDVKDILKISISRIQSMRILYDKLLISKKFEEASIKTYIESIIDSIIEIFDEKKNIVIKKEIPDFAVNTRILFPVGIMINELFTNIYKYAFKNRDKGIVSISINKNEAAIKIIIHDNGIGIDERINANKTPGFGLTIVKMLAKQLKGTYSMVNDNGTKSVIKFEI